MSSTENPAFAGTEQNADGIDIEAALRNGTLSSDEAVVLMEERLKAGEERMELRKYMQNSPCNMTIFRWY